MDQIATYIFRFYVSLFDWTLAKKPFDNMKTTRIRRLLVGEMRAKRTEALGVI